MHHTALRNFRAVFDFGSGTTKLAMCEKVSSSNWRTLFGEERETYVGYDVKRSGAKNAISDQVKNQVIHEVAFLVAQIRKFEQENKIPEKSIPSNGFATAVFRECTNGRQVLDEISQRFGFPIHIISQKQEGIAGFLTSAQLASDLSNNNNKETVARLPPHEELLSWDSGGSSFQIAHGRKVSSKNVLRNVGGSGRGSGGGLWQLQDIIEGPWGNSKIAHYCMKEIQKKSDAEMTPDRSTLNPCTAEEFEAMIKFVKADLKKRIDPEDFKWMKECIVDRRVPVVSIGGETSAFKLCSVLLGRSYEISPNDLRSLAKERFIGKLDEDIIEMGKQDYPGKELKQTHIAIGKLALLTAVMETFSIPHFAFFQSVGTTNGLAAMEELWALPSSKI